MNAHNNEAAAVDVLAVIDEAILRAGEDARQYRYDTDKDGDALRQARAAVAELVEAAQIVSEWEGQFLRCASAVLEDDVARLRAALSKFSGVA